MDEPLYRSRPAVLAIFHTDPSVLTPQLPSTPPIDLNKLQAKLLRTQLMEASNAAELGKECEETKRRSEEFYSTDEGRKLQVLLTLDGHERLYDVGTGKQDDPEKALPGNKRKEKKTRALARAGMLRQERFGAGMANQKDLDRQLARAIMSDGKFQDDLEYMDDNAKRFERKKVHTDAMRRQFAINDSSLSLSFLLINSFLITLLDYAKTQKVLANCVHSFGEDNSRPKAAVIWVLAATYNQSRACSEGDDDLWDEITRLIRMFDQEDKGVVFYEIIISLRWRKHTYIECFPVPYSHFEDMPGYFKESILMSESEWSLHKKLIDFSARPGGFRRAMVQNLPYFGVLFDYKGQKGFGHVIEGVEDAAGDGDDLDGAVDESEKGGGEFPE
ncbi:hypothetical protein FRC17_002101 [Serendipita sp. 399]|nr:hypothetical protein FRC17_002101 [Serendipita sp. 399]